MDNGQLTSPKNLTVKSLLPIVFCILIVNCQLTIVN